MKFCNREACHSLFLPLFLMKKNNFNYDVAFFHDSILKIGCEVGCEVAVDKL